MLYNTIEATKKICCAKGENTVDHNSVTWWLKKFCKGCKDDLAKLGRSNFMDSEAMIQAIKARFD